MSRDVRPAANGWSQWTSDASINGSTVAALRTHSREVDLVAKSVRSFYERGEKFRINHGSTNSTRSGTGRDPGKVVDTSRLNRVLLVTDGDAGKPYALVEPNVPMDRLVEETLKYGLIPPVVMEFPGITVGGGYAGTSGESSSFKHGFFDQTLEQVEMVLANGEVVVCSEDEHRDLFRGAAGAVGTLGVTTLVKLQLQKAKKYVEVTYHPVEGGMDEATAKLQLFTKRTNDYDYIDGIMYSKLRGAIITAHMTETLSRDLPIQRFSAASDPWFYLHVQQRISQRSEPCSEIIPLPDYLFRYDRGGFWVGAAAFKYFKPTPFNDTMRWFLDDFLHTRMLYTALHTSGQNELMIVQDLALPYDTAKEFVDFTDSEFGIFPLWLCPLKQSPSPTMHPHVDQYEADGSTLKPMLNVGLWGLAPAGHKAFLQANQDLERKLLELGGMKWLYAQTYYTEEQFWSQFDKPAYDALRRKYHATGLPTVYDKVRAEDEVKRADREGQKTWKQAAIDTWPLSGLYGLIKAIAGRSYIDARSSSWKDWVPRS
ncbi:hypothetical protein LTR62_000278 [Meristemomyces frigidus]|uniref:Delta(24)-sterol reductase n=1 Tax=Meristemomyces frigidus TaxID=1508187 RepID=A0AAN7YNT6_9PEZI|nr:hypothetical protein LTR62_000278 [Meristemomyces frigidus]